MPSLSSDVKSLSKSSSSQSILLSSRSFSMSIDSLPTDLHNNPMAMRPALPPDLLVRGEQRERNFYGLEQDGALRPGGQVPLVTRRTIGLLLNYVAIGALYGGISSAVMPFFGKYLQLDQHQVRAASMLINIASSLQAFGGWLTDSLRICGYRRKPYLIMGWILCIVSLLYLGASGTPAAGNTHVAWRYVLFMALGMIGICLASLTADAIVVEVAQREPLQTRGHTQVSIHAAKTSGMIIMSLFVTGTMNGSEYGGNFSWSLSLNQVMLVLAACSVMPLVASIWFLQEDPTAQTISILFFSDATSCPAAPQCQQPVAAHLNPPLDFDERCRLIWKLVQSHAMWQLLMFELVVSFCWTIETNAALGVEMAWLQVQAWTKAIEIAIWSLGFIGGLFMTRQFFLHYEWRYLYCVATIWTVCVNFVMVTCTVFNVVRKRNFWLYMQVLNAPAVALRFLVLLFPIVELAPHGIEGTTYGLVITFRNIAVPLGMTTYKAIGSHFSVSMEDVRLDSSSTRLQSFSMYIIAWIFQLAGIALIRLLPRQKLEVQQSRNYGGYSASGGWLVIIVLLTAFLYAVAVIVLSCFENTACLRIAGGSGCES